MGLGNKEERRHANHGKTIFEDFSFSSPFYLSLSLSPLHCLCSSLLLSPPPPPTLILVHRDLVSRWRMEGNTREEREGEGERKKVNGRYRYTIGRVWGGYQLERVSTATDVGNYMTKRPRKIRDKHSRQPQQPRFNINADSAAPRRARR